MESTAVVMAGHWLELLISGLATVSFTVLCVLLGDLKDQLKNNSEELKKNTDVQAQLNTKLAVMGAKFEGFEERISKDVGEIQVELTKAGERFQDVVASLRMLWQAGVSNGWKLPETPEIRRHN